MSAALSFIIVPQYVKYLGVESYGLIGFYSTTLALLQLFDLGLAPTLNREVARRSASGEQQTLPSLLLTLSRIYWLVACVAAIAFGFLAVPIATSWLRTSLPTETVVNAVRLMGLVFCVRWPVGLYQNAVMGAQRQRTVSLTTILVSLLNTAGGIIVLRFVSPTIAALFLWQAFVTAIQMLVLRYVAWNVVGGSRGARFDLSALRKTWKYSASMIGLSLAGLAFAQMDKVLLSRQLDLEHFSYYSLASMAAGGFSFIYLGFYNVVYPRFTSMVAEKMPEEDLWRSFRLYTQSISALMFSIAILLSFFARPLIVVWTGDSSLASNVAPLLAVLVLGTGIHGVMYVPHAMQLAYGVTRIALLLNTILAVGMLPGIIILTGRYGAFGGATAWLLFHIVYAVVGTLLMHRVFFVGRGLRWLLVDVAPAALVSGICGVLSSSALPLIEDKFAQLGLGVGVGCLALVASALVHPLLRGEIRIMVLGRASGSAA